MTFSRDRARLHTARERADLARLRFANALRGTRARLSPEHLKDDAIRAVSDRVEAGKNEVRRAIRRHPVVTGVAIAGLGASLFWKPARSVAIYGVRASQFIWLNRNLWRSTNDES